MPSDKIEVGLVELGRVFPQAGVPALGGRPFRAWDAVVDPPGQRDGNEDVLFASEHERRRADLAQLGEPGLDVVGEAVDQDDRLLAVAVELVMQVDVIDLCYRHRDYLLIGPGYGRAVR